MWEMHQKNMYPKSTQRTGVKCEKSVLGNVYAQEFMES